MPERPSVKMVAAVALIDAILESGPEDPAEAAQLNGIGLTTPRSRQWHPETIRSILNRCEKATP
jgi:hypothetical protein